jgi:hypothetical protein
LPALIVHTPRARLVRQPRDRVGRAADLVGVGRLKVLELEINAVVELDQRRPERRAGDARAGFLDIAERDRPHRFDHGLSSQRHAPARSANRQAACASIGTRLAIASASA